MLEFFLAVEDYFMFITYTLQMRCYTQGAIHIFILTEAMREQKIHNAREVRGL